MYVSMYLSISISISISITLSFSISISISLSFSPSVTHFRGISVQNGERYSGIEISFSKESVVLSFVVEFDRIGVAISDGEEERGGDWINDEEDEDIEEEE